MVNQNDLERLLVELRASWGDGGDDSNERVQSWLDKNEIEMDAFIWIGQAMTAGVAREVMKAYLSGDTEEAIAALNAGFTSAFYLGWEAAKAFLSRGEVISNL